MTTGFAQARPRLIAEEPGEMGLTLSQVCEFVSRQVEQLQVLAGLDFVVAGSAVETNGMAEQLALTALLQGTAVGGLEHGCACDDDIEPVIARLAESADGFAGTEAHALAGVDQTLDFFRRQL